jgi:hypothetical protein
VRRDRELAYNPVDRVRATWSRWIIRDRPLEWIVLKFCLLIKIYHMSYIRETYLLLFVKINKEMTSPPRTRC